MRLNKFALPVAILLTSSFWTISMLTQSAQAGSSSGGSVCKNPGGKTRECRDKNIKILTPKHGIPSEACRPGFEQAITNTLCFTDLRGATTYANAEANCRSLGARVADYGDWRTRILAIADTAPVGIWLGPITADDTALFVNINNTGNFDGETSRFDSRSYVCVHDR